MYGKWFASTYTGSMAGAGADVFAVWGYVVAHAGYGDVELNPVVVAALIGMPVENVQRAIDYLCQPDPQSRNEAEDGRRLVHEGAYRYKVVSQSMYRDAFRSEEGRREYNRTRQQRLRVKNKQQDQLSQSVAVCRSLSQSVAVSRSESPSVAQAEAEAEAEAEVLKKAPRSGAGLFNATDPFSPAAGSSQNHTETSDQAEMIASAVIDSIGVTSRWTRDQIVQQAKFELKANVPMDNIRDGMIGQWSKYREYVREGKVRPNMDMTPERFFGDGRWKSVRLWGLKKGVLIDGINLRSN